MKKFWIILFLATAAFAQEPPEGTPILRASSCVDVACPLHGQGSYVGCNNITYPKSHAHVRVNQDLRQIPWGIPCDVNMDGMATPVDVQHLVSVVFRGQQPTLSCDVNRDGYVTPTDVVFLSKVVFKGMPCE